MVWKRAARTQRIAIHTNPVRHSWYRSGDRGYNSSYGTKDSYKLTYRDGFEAGYEQSYRGVRGYGATAPCVPGSRFRASSLSG